VSTKKEVEEFLGCRHLAVVGVSRSGKEFSNTAYRELKQKGYRLVPVNPHADELEGERCYHRVSEIPDRPEGALLITNSSQTESVVRDAAEAGIRRLWIQQGCQSAGALELARQKGLSVVSGECILMFAEPVGSFHRFHRWVWKLLGKLPK
jgi:predicted CoA-binding protein